VLCGRAGRVRGLQWHWESGIAIDAASQCCPAALPPSTVCCAGASIDSCGVCGGLNECAARAVVYVGAGWVTAAVGAGGVAAALSKLQSNALRTSTLLVTNVSVEAAVGAASSDGSGGSRRLGVGVQHRHVGDAKRRDGRWLADGDRVAVAFSLLSSASVSTEELLLLLSTLDTGSTLPPSVQREPGVCVCIPSTPG
jgi:hypothetical protein